MRYYFIVGEPSGDLHASKVMEQIKAKDSSATFRFWGGDKMCEVAGNSSMVKHIKETSFMGFVDVIRNISKISDQLSLCKRDIAEFNPDVVVLVDYAGFNLKIAKFLKKRGIKCFYYIAPKVWAWREGRVKQLKRYVDELFVIFPFEVPYFRQKGINTHFYGNPIMDAINSRSDLEIDKESFCSTHNIESSKPLVALLSGSRKGEIRDNLPFMVEVASRMPHLNFAIAGVEWLDDAVYQKYLRADVKNVTLLKNVTYPLLKSADAAIVTSGTATLETALLGTPEMVCYYTPALTTIVGKLLIKIKYASLVNIILGREAVRELLHKHMTIDNAVEELTAIMEGGAKHEQIMSDYAMLHALVGESGVSEKVATQMVALLQNNGK